MEAMLTEITHEHRIEKQERPLFTGIDVGRVKCACGIWLDNIDAYTAHVATVVREQVARDLDAYGARVNSSAWRGALRRAASIARGGAA